MILLQIHFNKKWYLMTIYAYGYSANTASMFSIYIDVNGCTKWPYVNTY